MQPNIATVWDFGHIHSIKLELIDWRLIIPSIQVMISGFWFQDHSGDPMGVYWLRGVHLIHCAYNNLWMGQIIQPDWDMFQFLHWRAKFHAGSRAICGGPVYVSDSIGGHDFDLIKKLVFPDGTIPKCQHYALRTTNKRLPFQESSIQLQNHSQDLELKQGNLATHFNARNYWIIQLVVYPN